MLCYIAHLFKALLTVQRQTSSSILNMEHITKSTTEPIAIIGTSCRFPGGANSPSKLWELLKHPVDLSNDVPPSRFAISGFYHEDAEHSGVSNTASLFYEVSIH
jgi:hypothetical protein